MESKDNPIELEANRQALAESMEKTKTGIVLTGRIKDGKVELDQSAVDKIAKKYPNADISFVAVNAPFDPKAIELCGPS